jgi:hypothetical protein
LVLTCELFIQPHLTPGLSLDSANPERDRHSSLNLAKLTPAELPRVSSRLMIVTGIGTKTAEPRQRRQSTRRLDGCQCYANPL